MQKSTKRIASLLLAFLENPITIGFSISLLAIPLYLYMSKSGFDFIVSSNDLGIIQSFILWFGVPYGLLIALVLINTWTQFDTVAREFSSEADSISNFLNTLEFIQIKSPKTKQEIAYTLSKYINHVVQNYQIEHYERDILRHGDYLLRSLQVTLAGLIYKNKSRPIHFGDKLIESYQEIIDARQVRLSISRFRMPSAIQILSVISSILWIAPFYALQFDNQIIGSALTVGVTFTIVSLLTIIMDLNEPFNGTWKIYPEEFVELENSLKQ